MKRSPPISPALVVLIAGLAGGFSSSSAQADRAYPADRVVARNDAVTLPVGATARVAVLANDRFTGKRAEVRVTGVPVPDRHGLSVSLTRAQKLVVRSFPTTDAGEYIVTYRLIGTGGLKDKAKVAITVVPAT